MQRSAESILGNILMFLSVQVQFNVHDLNKDVLEITVFDQDIFSPNGRLYLE